MMFVPINACKPLGGFKRALSVRWDRKAPSFLYIPTESDNDNPLTVLWNPKIGSVHFLENDAVAEAALDASSVVLLQLGMVLRPGIRILSG
jgi:hypothetical protein